MNRPSSPQTEGKFTNSCLTSQIMNLISNQTVIVEAVPTAETVLAEPEQKKPMIKNSTLHTQNMEILQTSILKINQPS